MVLLDLRSGPPASTYPERHQLVRFFEDVIEQLRGAPGGESASAVSNLPMQSIGVAFVLPFNVEGQPSPENEDPRGRRPVGQALQQIAGSAVIVDDQHSRRRCLIR